jgi:hypothetical protein
MLLPSFVKIKVQNCKIVIIFGSGVCSNIIPIQIPIFGIGLLQLRVHSNKFSDLKASCIESWIVIRKVGLIRQHGHPWISPCPPFNKRLKELMMLNVLH